MFHKFQLCATLKVLQEALVTIAQAASSFINQTDPMAQKSEETLQLEELVFRGRGKTLNA